MLVPLLKVLTKGTFYICKRFFLSPSLSLLKTKKEGFNGDNILFPNALFLCLLRSRPLKLNVPF